MQRYFVHLNEFVLAPSVNHDGEGKRGGVWQAKSEVKRKRGERNRRINSIIIKGVRVAQRGCQPHTEEVAPGRLRKFLVLGRREGTVIKEWVVGLTTVGTLVGIFVGTCQPIVRIRKQLRECFNHYPRLLILGVNGVVPFPAATTSMTPALSILLKIP